MDDSRGIRQSSADGAGAHDEWVHDLRTSLTVVKLQLTQLRRRVRRAGGDAVLDAELDQIEATLNVFTATIARIAEAENRER